MRVMSVTTNRVVMVLGATGADGGGGGGAVQPMVTPRALTANRMVGETWDIAG